MVFAPVLDLATSLQGDFGSGSLAGLGGESQSDFGRPVNGAPPPFFGGRQFSRSALSSRPPPFSCKSPSILAPKKNKSA